MYDISGEKHISTQKKTDLFCLLLPHMVSERKKIMPRANNNIYCVHDREKEEYNAFFIFFLIG
jgi:hypothetical protein